MNPICTLRLRNRSRAGITLVEVMIAATIAVLVSSAALWMLTEGMTSSLRTANISSNDLTQWGINNRLVLDTRVASGVVVYSTFSSATVAAESTTDGAGYIGDESSVTNGRGNFLVLYASRFDRDLNIKTYTRLTGFAYDKTKHTVSRFVYPATAADEAALKAFQLANVNNRDHSAIIVNFFSRIDTLIKATKPIAENVYVADFDSTEQAFCRRGPNEANLSFKLGDPSQAKRVKDSRLVEVSFFVRE